MDTAASRRYARSASNSHRHHHQLRIRPPPPISLPGLVVGILTPAILLLQRHRFLSQAMKVQNKYMCFKSSSSRLCTTTSMSPAVSPARSFLSPAVSPARSFAFVVAAAV